MAVSTDAWFRERQAASPARQNTFATVLLILFLVLEYVRPPGLAQLRLQFLIIVVMFFLWCAAQSRPWSGILTAQVLFVLVCLQAIPFSYNYYSAYETSRTMFGHLSIALGLSWLLATRRTFRLVTWTWLLVMSYAAVYGITHDGSGPGAMLGDENDLALGCATAFPFAFYGFERFSGRRRWASAAVGGLLIIAIVKSFSRGGLVALAAVGFYCWLASKHKLRALVTVTLSGALLMLLAQTMSCRANLEDLGCESYGSRMSTMFNTNEGTAEGRRFLWAAARNMWMDNPILGVGVGNFKHLAGRYQPKEGYEKPEYQDRDYSGTVTHSLYFQLLAETGSVGILLLASVLWAHFQTLRRSRRQIASQPNVSDDLKRDVELYSGALGGAVIGYCAAGAFLSVAYYPYLWYFSAMAVALDTSIQRELAALQSARA